MLLKNNTKFKVFTIILIIIPILFISIMLGSIRINPADTINILLHKIFNIPLKENITTSMISIIWVLRLPRVIIAFLIGAALSVAGCVLQSTLKNPLASSYTLGVSSGAALGASIAIILNISSLFAVPVFALVFGVLSIFIVIAFASKIDKQMNVNTIILFGLIFSIFINALQGLIMLFSDDSIRNIVFWQMGSFASKGFTHIIILLPIILVSVLILYSKNMALDILTFGEDSSLSMGINQKKMKWIFILISTVLTGVSVAFVGIIGFVDIIAPHITRRLFGSSHRLIIIGSFLIGGIFMVIADLLARVLIAPNELPVGMITALLGAPFFAYVYFIGGKK